MPPKAKPTKGKANAKPKAHQKAKLLSSGTLLKDIGKQSWKVNQLLAEGGFGHVYTCAPSTGSKWAEKAGSYVIKVEPMGNGPLFTEIHVYQGVARPQMLADFKKERRLQHLAVPPFISAGTCEAHNIRFLVMPRCGTDLDKVRETAGGSISVALCENVTEQCVRALDYLNTKGYVHADVKGENLLFEPTQKLQTAAQQSKARVYLTDFGLAKKVGHAQEEKPDKKRAHNGTLPFTSLDAHRGASPSFRADLEILAYNVVYWATGQLPWFFEEDADSVLQQKEQLLSKRKTQLPTLMPSPSTARLQKAVLCMLDEVARTNYADLPDYGAVLNALGASSAAAGKKGKRRSTTVAAAAAPSSSASSPQSSDSPAASPPSARADKKLAVKQATALKKKAARRLSAAKPLAPVNGASPTSSTSTYSSATSSTAGIYKSTSSALMHNGQIIPGLKNMPAVKSPAARKRVTAAKPKRSPAAKPKRSPAAEPKSSPAAEPKSSPAAQPAKPSPTKRRSTSAAKSSPAKRLKVTTKNTTACQTSPALWEQPPKTRTGRKK